jgi:outer membrane protein assembly factor BamE (lipoprotein component of BamABCDE complex)
MKLIFLPILFLLASCSTKHINGQYFSNAEIESLNSGSSNKKDVIATLGSPTFISEDEPNTWYYISRTVKNGPFIKPKLLEQKILKLSFDGKDKLSDVQVVIDNQNRLNLDQNTTYTYGKNESGLQHFVKNFGRFNSKREKKR